MKYSLANYILSIEPNDPTIKTAFGTISIGGEGNHIGEMSAEHNTNQWSTEGYATGAWVHNKSLDKTGTISIQLNQLSPVIAKLKKMCMTFYDADYDGFTLSLTTSDGKSVCRGIDCYITKIPSQVMAASAANQSWSWTAGQIIFD